MSVNQFEYLDHDGGVYMLRWFSERRWGAEEGILEPDCDTGTMHTLYLLQYCYYSIHNMNADNT